ncbi:hypothetical protein JCM10207_003514 [Rhodosporidiobolus poonsookiae]
MSRSARSDVLNAIFAHVKAKDFAALDNIFSPESVWEMHPPSMLPHLSRLPSDGKCSYEQIKGAWTALMGELFSELKTLDTVWQVEQNDRLVALCTMHATLKNGQPDSKEVVFFVEFEPGSAKVKRGGEFLDSAHAIEVAKELGVHY